MSDADQHTTADDYARGFRAGAEAATEAGRAEANRWIDQLRPQESERERIEWNMASAIRDQMLAAIRALPIPAAPAREVRVRVKPLEWRSVDEICTREIADALGGKMMIVEVDPGSEIYSAGFDIGGLAFRFVLEQDPLGLPGQKRPVQYETIGAAKAAAQVDYERRVLSALEEQPREVSVAEAARVLLASMHEVRFGLMVTGPKDEDKPHMADRFMMVLDAIARGLDAAEAENFALRALAGEDGQ